MKFRVLSLSLVIALLLSVSAVFAQDQNIVELASETEDLSTLVDLVSAAGLVDALSEGELTVFAPTNDAFAALPDFVIEYLGSNPELLTQVLTYHVVEGAVMSGDLSDGMTATTLAGEDVEFTVDDMGVMVNASSVVTADVEASNGVVHIIDRVLIPEIELPMVFPADVSGDIITAGSSTVGPVTIEAASNFSDEGYMGQITVDIIGSGAGLARFCEAGDSDIANASRPIRDSEIEQCGTLDPARTPIEIRVGTDALAVVVNPANDFATDLTMEELAAAFSTATTWADVRDGFPAEEILRFIPGTDSGTFDYFVEEVFEEDPEPILNAENTQLSEDDNVLLNGVANNQYAIGFFGYAYYSQNEDSLTILNIDGVAPVKANVDNATYPLARPLFIYTDAGIVAEKPQVGSFINYYLTNVSQFIETVGYFDANEYVLRAAKLEVLALTAE